MPASVLLVEPDRDSRLQLGKMLEEQGYHVCEAANGAEAHVYFEAREYDLIVAALMLPDGSGSTVATAIREHHPDVATVVIAHDGDLAVARKVLGAGVDGYLVRPLIGEQVAVTLAAALERCRDRQQARRRGDRLRELLRPPGELGRQGLGEVLLRRLAAAARLRDEETAEHMQRMSESCAAIARQLGLPAGQCESLRSAALVHDIGKVGIPDAVLRKPGKLTGAERHLIERHPTNGHEILTGSGDSLVELAATIALTHHERVDGRGYPRGLCWEEIPLPGRIAAVADVFDALTHDRVYRTPHTVEDALALMEEGRGTQFDVQVFDAFKAILPEMVAIGERLPDQPRPEGELNGQHRDPEPGDQPRVLIVEDHEAVGRGLELLLRGEGMRIAGSAPNLSSARTILARRAADVAIVDVDLGAENGIDFVEEAHAHGARVLLYTGRADAELLAAASKSPALGVATKAGSPTELIAGVRAVARGEHYRDPRLTAAV